MTSSFSALSYILYIAYAYGHLRCSSWQLHLATYTNVILLLELALHYVISQLEYCKTYYRHASSDKAHWAR